MAKGQIKPTKPKTTAKVDTWDWPLDTTPGPGQNPATKPASVPKPKRKPAASKKKAPRKGGAKGK
jgi:hypothetical protein